MARKIYTSREMRDVAKCYTCSEVPLGFDKRDIAAMLRQAADMIERCEKMICPCNLEDAPCVPSDDGYCDSCDVPNHNKPFNYILYGDVGK